MCLHRPDIVWDAPASGCDLPHDEAHVWALCLTPDISRVRRCQHLLSDDERKRAKRFHFQRDHDEFVVTRGVLRMLIGDYLGCDPTQTRFTFGPQGKPGLVPSSVRLHFNISHSAAVALLAFAVASPVGVDVELIRQDIDVTETSRSFFSPREVTALRSMSPDHKTTAFFLCWTRKEAYIKANGGGLSIPLDQFDVSLSPDGPAELLETRHMPAEAQRWCLHDVSPADGYVGALAVERHIRKVRCWRWEE